MEIKASTAAPEFDAAGIYFLLAAGGMVWYSKVGKVRIRDRILEIDEYAAG